MTQTLFWLLIGLVILFGAIFHSVTESYKTEEYRKKILESKND